MGGIAVAGSVDVDVAMYLRLDSRFYRVDETSAGGATVLDMPLGNPAALAVFETAALANCRRENGGAPVTSDAILLFNEGTEVQFVVERSSWTYTVARIGRPYAVFSVNTAAGDVVCDGEDTDPANRIMRNGFEPTG